MSIDNLQVVIEPGDPLSAEALELLRQMRAEALQRYADVLADSAPPINEPLVSRSAFLLARLGVQPVGCAALRPLIGPVAEIKRMYVSKSVRRHRLAGISGSHIVGSRRGSFPQRPRIPPSPTSSARPDDTLTASRARTA